MIFPKKKEFLKAARAGSIYPLCTKLTDIKSWGTPLDIYEKLAVSPKLEEYTYILETGRSHPKTGRYSYIGTMPFLTFASKGEDILIKRLNHRGKDISARRCQGYPFSFLEKILNDYQTVKTEELPDFSGGAVGYIAYDACHFFEDLPKQAIDDLGIPDIFFVFSRVIIAFDHLQQDLKVMAAPLVDTKAGKNKYELAYEQAAEDIGLVVKKISQSSSGIAAKEKNILPGYNLSIRNFTRGDSPQAISLDFNKGAVDNNRYVRSIDNNLSLESNFSQSGFEKIVAKAKDYIRAGDIFQANLSQRLSAPLVSDPWLVYKTLSRINPSPFACYLNLGQIKIASSSPERLVKVEDQLVETRPIAGTRPRGKDGTEDIELSRELIISPKERAEHIMLVDLERNDLGRVCEYGSVKVDELMVLEEYSHVIHIVSNVSGVLRADKNRFDLIAASFPGGTITGTPKVRCMEIIDELEPLKRGIYTGSAGYLSFNGDMDLNIIIRTFLLTQNRAYVQVGAGIVADSDPEQEYYETLYKAEALLKTLQITGSQTQ